MLDWRRFDITGVLEIAISASIASCGRCSTYTGAAHGLLRILHAYFWPLVPDCGSHQPNESILEA